MGNDSVIHGVITTMIDQSYYGWVENGIFMTSKYYCRLFYVCRDEKDERCKMNNTTFEVKCKRCDSVYIGETSVNAYTV